MTGGAGIPPPIVPERSARSGLNPWTVAVVFSLLMFVVGSDLNLIAPFVLPIARSFHVSAGGVGWLVTVFAAGSALASPLAGGLADHLGHRKVLHWGLGGFVVFDALTGLAPTFPLLVVARAFTGMSAGAVSSMAYALVADVIPRRMHARAMSVVSMGFSLSTVAGVPLGMLFARELGWRGTMLAIAVALVAVGAAVQGVLRPWRLASHPAPAGRHGYDARTLLRLSWPSLSASLLAFFAVGMVYTYLPAFLESQGIRHFTELLYILSGYGAANLAGNYVLGRLGDRRGPWFAVHLAQLAEAATIIGMGFSAAFLPLWTDILWAWAFAFAQAYIPDLKALAGTVPLRVRASSLAWNNTAMYAGMMIGSGIGARLFCPSTFWILAGIAAMAVLLGFGITDRQRTPATSRG